MVCLTSLSPPCSSGIYKMILRSHMTVIQLGQRAQEMLKLTKDDVIYCDFPVSWMSGLTMTYLTAGYTMVKSTLHNCPAQRVVREVGEFDSLHFRYYCVRQYTLVQIILFDVSQSIKKYEVCFARCHICSAQKRVQKCVTFYLDVSKAD